MHNVKLLYYTMTGSSNLNLQSLLRSQQKSIMCNSPVGFSVCWLNNYLQCYQRKIHPFCLNLPYFLSMTGKLKDAFLSLVKDIRSISLLLVSTDCLETSNPTPWIHLANLTPQMKETIEWDYYKPAHQRMTWHGCVCPHPSHGMNFPALSA